MFRKRQKIQYVVLAAIAIIWYAAWQMFYPFRCNWDSWRNILFFIPLGIIAAGSKKKWLFVIMGIACGIEILEYCTSIGIVDIDDVIYRILRIAIGYAVGKLVLMRNKVQLIET